jgi:hypothetical protein
MLSIHKPTDCRKKEKEKKKNVVLIFMRIFSMIIFFKEVQ